MKRRTDRLEERLYPDYRGEDDLFRDLLDLLPAEGEVVVDAGCGSGRFGHDLRRRARLVVGVDLAEDIRENELVDYRVIGNLESMPLADTCAGLVVLKYVLEHLPRPQAVFSEVARVLRPGGLVALHTPNRFHYVAVAASLLPHSLHERINAARGRPEADTFPTFYRANSRRAIARLARSAGLEVAEMRTAESKPNYLVFSRLAYLAGAAYERVVNRFGFLAGLRVNIFVVLRKPAE